MQEQEIGRIMHYFGKVSVGIVKLLGELKVGDTIHVKGVHDDFTQVIESMQIEHLSVNEAKAGDEIGIKVSGKVHENDKVFKVIA